MKKAMFLGLTLLSFNTNAIEKPGIDTRCFISMDNKIKMRLLTVSAKEWGGGYVQYGEKKSKISIVETKESEETLLEGRPAIVDEEWVEVVDGNINGKYHFTYQGAIFDKIEYISPKGVKFQFKQTDYDYDDCFSER